MFLEFLKWGFQHILDFHAYDHLLFLLALCAVYTFKSWKEVLILVTAFTIGHSLTLSLAALNLISVNKTLVEALIPVTIVLTGIFNVANFGKTERYLWMKYPVAMCFGLIHGLGFSNQFQSLVSENQSILSMLFPFNLGVELGQIVIVICALTVNTLVVKRVKQKNWVIWVSAIAIIIATYLFITVILES